MIRSIRYGGMSFVLTILTVWGCAPSSHATLQIHPYPVVLEAADQHAANGARTDAEAAYVDAAALRPDNPTPYLRLATLYGDWNRPEEGLVMLALAEARGAPSSATLPLSVAFHATTEDWQNVVAVDLASTTDNATRRRVARAHVALGQIAEAISVCETLLSHNPTDRQAHELLGALLAIVAPAEAGPHLEAAGTALARDLVTALDEHADTDHVYRLARLGQALINQEEWYIATLALERAAAQNPAYADANALLGHTLDQRGRPMEARGHLETAVQQAPESYLAQSLLGLHYLQAGELGSARPHLEAAYELDPENPAIALYLGYLYADLGYIDAANIWFEEAILLAPDDPTVSEAVVRFYLSRDLGEEEWALETAQLLVDQAPEVATAYDLLGWSQFLFGHVTEAEANLRYAIELNPELASAHYHLGRIAATVGDSRAARAELGRAMDLNTDPVLRSQIEQAIADLRSR
jgi:Flp pilus assembly protein TadD